MGCYLWIAEGHLVISDLQIVLHAQNFTEFRLRSLEGQIKLFHD